MIDPSKSPQLHPSWKPLRRPGRVEGFGEPRWAEVLGRHFRWGPGRSPRTSLWGGVLGWLLGRFFKHFFDRKTPLILFQDWNTIFKQYFQRVGGRRLRMLGGWWNSTSFFLVLSREWMGMGLLGLLFIVMKWVIPSFPIWSTSKSGLKHIHRTISRTIIFFWGQSKLLYNILSKSRIFSCFLRYILYALRRIVCKCPLSGWCVPISF